MELIRNLKQLEEGHRFDEIKSKINLYFIDVTNTKRTPERCLKLLRANGIVFNEHTIHLIGNKYVSKQTGTFSYRNGYIIEEDITPDILNRFIKSFRTSIGYSGTVNILVLGGKETWEGIKYWCNGAMIYGDEVPEGFVNTSAKLEGHTFIRRPFKGEMNHYNLMLNTIHYSTQIPDTRSTTFTITLGGFLLGLGTSSARPSVKYDRELGIKYSKAKALDDAKERIGTINSFSETINGWFTPRTRAGFTLYNYADLTYKNTK